jgi:hypothetical protein
MIEIGLRRRFFAEELEAVCKLRTPALVSAFAQVAREEFLPPGPWTVLADSDLSYPIGSGPQRMRSTPDADPARVYHNIAVAIDPERQLFNGQPGTLGFWIDLLELAPGARVLHVGAARRHLRRNPGECRRDASARQLARRAGARRPHDAAADDRDAGDGIDAGQGPGVAGHQGRGRRLCRACHHRGGRLLGAWDPRSSDERSPRAGPDGRSNEMDGGHTAAPRHA